MFRKDLTLATLVEKQAQLDEGKQDYSVSTTKLAAHRGDSTIGVCVPSVPDLGAFRPTDHALRQLAATHGLSAKQWREMEQQECPSDVREAYATLLDETFEHRWGLKSTDPKRLLRTQGGRLRAVLSAGYGVFNNSRALELTQRAFDTLDQSGADVRVYDAHQDSDELCIRVFAPGRGRDEGGGSSPVYPGVYIGNSEIGTRKLYVKPLVLRQVCSNGMMGIREDGAGMQRVHRGSMMILENDFNMALADALNLADEQVIRFLQLTQQRVADPLRELGKIWAKNSKRSEFTQEKFTVAEELLKRYVEQFDETKYSVVNALTDLAKSYDDVNERLVIEEIAGLYAFAD